MGALYVIGTQKSSTQVFQVLVCFRQIKNTKLIMSRWILTALLALVAA